MEQKISVFSKEDIPVTMGLVIDNSGSMREKRPQVNAAALSFVRTSNAADEVFVVNFNDEYYLDLDEDFTSNPQELHDALERIDTRGSTALYDAIIGSLDHLKKGHKDKRVLLVITDGDDDASRKDFPYTVKAAVESNAVIYAIGVFSDDDRKNNKKMIRKSKKELTTLAEATGGLAFFPDSLADVDPVCVQVARDIRNQYTLGYYPTNTAKDGSFRSVKLDLIPPKGRGKLTVRTRTGYYAQKGLARRLVKSGSAAASPCLRGRGLPHSSNCFPLSSRQSGAAARGISLSSQRPIQFSRRSLFVSAFKKLAP